MKTRQNQDKSTGRPAWDKASPRVPASPPGRKSCERVVMCISRRFLPLQSSPAGVGQAVNRTDGQTHAVGAQQRQFETTRKLNSRKLPASSAGAAGSRWARVARHTYTATPRLHGGGRPRRGALLRPSSHSDGNELQHRQEGLSRNGARQEAEGQGAACRDTPAITQVGLLQSLLQHHCKCHSNNFF